MTASPISGPVSTTHPADVRRAAAVLPSRSTHRHLGPAPPASDDRLHVPDVQPLVVGLDEAAGADHGAVGVLQQAGVEGVRAVASITCSARRRAARSFAGSTCTCRCGSRSPQIATWATPGTRSSRARIFQ